MVVQVQGAPLVYYNLSTTKFLAGLRYSNFKKLAHTNTSPKYARLMISGANLFTKTGYLQLFATVYMHT